MGDKTVPDCGWYDPDLGVIAQPVVEGPAIAVTFYRSYVTAADTAPVDALIRAFRAKGLCGLSACSRPSLKAPGTPTFSCAKPLPI